MAQRRGPVTPTRKHLARAERERLITRYILGVTIIVIVAVVGLLAYGFIDEAFIKPGQAVASVNDATITTEEFQTRVRYDRRQLVNQYISLVTTMQQFGTDTGFSAFFGNNLQQIEFQLANSEALGRGTLNNLIDEELVRQEATRRGISVSSEEIDEALQRAFGYFPDGEPTPTATFEPLATSTLTALQQNLVTATPTLTVTQTPTALAEPTATSAEGEADPTQAPTPATTFEEYQASYQGVLDALAVEIEFTEADLRRLFEGLVLREKLREVITADLDPREEQVWARHILVEDEEAAKQLLERLESGEAWADLAAELSTDESNKDQGGDLGWFSRGRMVSDFEDMAFELDVGAISEPVETDFGWHVIQVLGHEERPVAPIEFEQFREQRFREWLADNRLASNVEILDTWMNRVPTDPSIPFNVQAIAQQLMAGAAAPPITVPTVESEGESTPEPTAEP